MANWAAGCAPAVQLGTSSGSFTASGPYSARAQVMSPSASSWYSAGPSAQRAVQGPPCNLVRAVSPPGPLQMQRRIPTTPTMPDRSPSPSPTAAFRAATSDLRARSPSPSPTAAFRAAAYGAGMAVRSASAQPSASPSLVSVSIAPPGSVMMLGGPLEGFHTSGSSRSTNAALRVASPTPPMSPMMSSAKVLSVHAPSSASTSATSGTPEVSKSADLAAKLALEQSSRSEALAASRPGSLQLSAKLADQAPWAIHHSFRLSPQAENSQVKLLDRTAVSSVSGAVDKLNRGILSCPEGICMVYSASNRAYYCLHRPEKREAAQAIFRRQPGSLKPETTFLSKSNGRVPRLPVQRIQSMPLMMKSQPAGTQGFRRPEDLIAEEVDRLGESRLEVLTSGSISMVDTSGLGSASIVDPGSRISHSPPACQRTGLPPRQLEASRSRALSPDQITRQSLEKESSASISSMRSALPTPSSPSLKVARQESTHTVERASSAQSSGLHGHYSPRNRKRVLGSTSPQRGVASHRLALTRALPSSAAVPPSETDTPRAGSQELTGCLDDVATSSSLIGPPQVQDERVGEHDVTDEVDIARRTFQLMQVIGRGAFGVVWMAREKGMTRGKEIAVKAVTAKDGPGFATATFEAELLQILTAAMPAAARVHVPQYIAHSSTRASGTSGGGTVRLAMSFVPGGALDKWLYGISDEEHKSVDVAQLVDGHLPGGQQGSWMFSDACSVVRVLLMQLSTVFFALQPIAFHRDVSSHNVLVNFPDPQQVLRPSFALIDFGLAVRSGSWIREWRNSNLAGDPRYWTPSAWMAFAFGFKYVATHPNAGFQSQYLGRMDHFSLGVLGLETLFALWHSGEAYEGNLPGLLEVRVAWCKYWTAVIHLFQMFHRQGAQEVRQFLAQSQDEGVTTLCNHLRQLRQSLRTAAAQPLNVRFAALLRVLADLMDERGTVSWTEIPLMLGEDFTEVVASPSQRVATSVEPRRSSMSLAETPPRGRHHSMEHRRIRSTGGSLDCIGSSELRRFQPEISPAFKTMQSQHSMPQWTTGGLSHSSFSPDLLSRSFQHTRPLSGYM